MDDAKSPTKEISRRSLLKSIPVIAGVAASFGAAAMPDAAVAQTKLTHKDAKYQETPHDGQQCSTCLQFVAPHSCKIVADPITPHGWCQFYGKKT